MFPIFQSVEKGPWPPLTRGLSTELTGGESPVSFSRSAGKIMQLFSPSGPSGHLPRQREACVSPLAPSDEGAVNGVDWGRECSVFSGNIWDYRNIFSPSGPSGHLPHQREAWVSAFRHAGGGSSEGGLGFRSFKGFSSRGRLFQSVRAADTSPIHYSLLSILYYLIPPSPGGRPCK